MLSMGTSKIRILAPNYDRSTYDCSSGCVDFLWQRPKASSLTADYLVEQQIQSEEEENSIG